MHRRLGILGLVLLLTVGANADAWAAKKVKRPARAHVPVRSAPSSQAGLRGALPGPVSVAPPPAPPSLAWPPPPALRRLGQGESSLANAGLVGLRARTDPAPLCRTACAQARYQCQTAEQSDGCDSSWSRCVLSCREPPRP